MDVDAFGDVPRRRRGALARLVVGVGVDVHQPEAGALGKGGMQHAPHTRCEHSGVISHGLDDRYGTPAPWRRRVLVAACVALAVVFLAWIAWTAWFHATPDVESDLEGFAVDGEHAVTVKVHVQLDDADVHATCLVRAIAEDHTIVGELSFTPEYGARQPLELTVRTERRATAIEFVGCTSPGQPRPQ